MINDQAALMSSRSGGHHFNDRRGGRRKALQPHHATHNLSEQDDIFASHKVKASVCGVL